MHNWPTPRQRQQEDLVCPMTAALLPTDLREMRPPNDLTETLPTRLFIHVMQYSEYNRAVTKTAVRYDTIQYEMLY